MPTCSQQDSHAEIDGEVVEGHVVVAVVGPNDAPTNAIPDAHWAVQVV